MFVHCISSGIISNSLFSVLLLLSPSSLSLLPPPPSPLSPSSLSSTNQVVGFSLGQVAIFIAVLCVTSVVAQTAGLTLLMSLVGNKYCIIVGLFLQATQLVIYGISTSTWYVDMSSERRRQTRNKQADYQTIICENVTERENKHIVHTYCFSSLLYFWLDI